MGKIAATQNQMFNEWVRIRKKDPDAGTGRTIGGLLSALAAAQLGRGHAVEFRDHHRHVGPYTARMRKMHATELRRMVVALGLDMTVKVDTDCVCIWSNFRGVGR